MFVSHSRYFCKVKKRSLIFTAVLLGSGLIGLIFIQSFFIYESYTLKSQLFDQMVNESLGNVSARLEKEDAVNFIFAKSQVPKLQFPKLNIPKNISEVVVDKPKGMDTLFTSFSPPVIIRNQLLPAKDSTHNITIMRDKVFINGVAVMDTKLLKRLNEKTNSKIYSRDGFVFTQSTRASGIAGSMGKINHDTTHFMVVNPPRIVNPQVINAKPKVTTNVLPNLERQVKAYIDSVQKFQKQVEIFEQIAIEFEQSKLPLSSRINPSRVDSLLRQEFTNKGIDIPFNYTVYSNRKDSVIFSKASLKPEITSSNTYRTNLFPQQVVADMGYLMVNFPDKRNYLLSKMTFIMGTSAGLILVILFCFAYTLYTIMQQKKLSEMKTDFINNMTHELKTPISTIMIASGALLDDEIVHDKKHFKKLASIIQEENQRMFNNVDRVLNIAKLDKGDFKLNISTVSIHILLEGVAESMQLQLNKKKASIQLILTATSDLVVCDELHLSNVIYNLIDNALKYNKSEPVIQIATKNNANAIQITVSDNGIGMTREQCNRVFEQFYRAPTGNLHDVKGFGLGLSYVNSIVRMTGGTVAVKSELHKGSDFEVTLPLRIA